MLTNNIIRW